MKTSLDPASPWPEHCGSPPLSSRYKPSALWGLRRRDKDRTVCHIFMDELTLFKVETSDSSSRWSCLHHHHHHHDQVSPHLWVSQAALLSLLRHHDPAPRRLDCSHGLNICLPSHTSPCRVAPLVLLFFQGSRVTLHSSSRRWSPPASVHCSSLIGFWTPEIMSRCNLTHQNQLACSMITCLSMNE